MPDDMIVEGRRMSSEARHLTLNLSKRHRTIYALDKLNDCIGDAVCLFLSGVCHL